MNFEFKPELFEYRNAVMETLAAFDFWWFSSFRSIDLDHSEFFLEIDGIQTEDVARGIVKVLSSKFKWGLYVYRHDNREQDWVVRIYALERGVIFGGTADGRRGGRPGVDPRHTKPEEEGVAGEPPDADPDQKREAVEGDRDGDPQVEETNSEEGPPGKQDASDEEKPAESAGEQIGGQIPEEGSPTVPGDDQQQNPMSALMGGKKMKALAPEEIFEQFATILQRASRRNYVPGISLALPAGAGGNEEEWNGWVAVIARVKDLDLTIGQLGKIMPLLRDRPDLLDLLGEAVLVARRDWLDWFVAHLPSGVARRWESVVLQACCHRCHIQILGPSKPESWRIAFTAHAAAIHQVLNDEMLRLAAEGEE